jgi:hypothetical protein
MNWLQDDTALIHITISAIEAFSKIIPDKYRTLNSNMTVLW